jgi:hypothetical protein
MLAFYLEVEKLPLWFPNDILDLRYIEEKFAQIGLLQEGK